MNKDQAILSIKSGAKWFIYVAEIIAISGFIFLFFMMYSTIQTFGPESIFLAVVFGGGIAGGVYLLIYANKHYVVFNQEGLIRHGIFSTKFISYSEIDEIWFSRNFWDFKSGMKIVANNSNLNFDFKYKNQEAVVRFIVENINENERPKVFLDQENYAALVS